MTFPVTPLDVRVEAFIRGQWINFGPFVTITEDYYVDEYVDEYLGREVLHHNRLPHQSIDHNVGRRDHYSTVSPGSISLFLWNEDGALTPGNRESDYWARRGQGGWGLATPLRLYVDGEVEFDGEITSIVPQWPHGDLSVSDVLTVDGEPVTVDGEEVTVGYSDTGFAIVNIEASGILRRLGQGRPPLRSTIRRAVNMQADRVMAYWSLEDGAGATDIAPGLTSTSGRSWSPLKFRGLSLASDTSTAGSEALPTVAEGQNAEWGGPVDHGTSGRFTFECVGVRFPKEPIHTDELVRHIIECSGGTIRYWYLDTGAEVSGGDQHPFFRVWATDTDGNVAVYATFERPRSFAERPKMFRFDVRQNGADVQWKIHWDPILGDTFFFPENLGEELGWLTDWVDVAGQTVGTPIGYSGAVVKAFSGGVTIGQVIIHDGIDQGWLEDPKDGHVIEYAADRAERLCAEEGVPLRVVHGDSGRSMQMGPQRPGQFLDLLQECAAADSGVLTEERRSLGLVYRTGHSRLNREPVMVLDAAGASDIANPFSPVEDDQTVRTMVTATRTGGGSVTVIDEDAAAEPPDGWGRIEQTLQVNIRAEFRLPYIADWWLHVGTWDDGMRYPQITVDLAIAPHQSVAFAALEVGDWIQVVNLPPQHPLWPGPVTLVVEGWSQTLEAFGRTVTFNCSPAGPWQVAKWGPGHSRYAPKNCTLAEAIDATETTIDLSLPGKKFRVSPSDNYPLDIVIGECEQATVLSAAGTDTDVQTLTVIRNVNGLARAHDAGEPVRLADRPILGLFAATPS